MCQLQVDDDSPTASAHWLAVRGPTAITWSSSETRVGWASACSARGSVTRTTFSDFLAAHLKGSFQIMIRSVDDDLPRLLGGNEWRADARRNSPSPGRRASGDGADGSRIGAVGPRQRRLLHVDPGRPAGARHRCGVVRQAGRRRLDGRLAGHGPDRAGGRRRGAAGVPTNDARSGPRAARVVRPQPGRLGRVRGRRGRSARSPSLSPTPARA